MKSKSAERRRIRATRHPVGGRRENPESEKSLIHQANGFVEIVRLQRKLDEISAKLEERGKE